MKWEELVTQIFSNENDVAVSYLYTADTKSGN